MREIRARAWFPIAKRMIHFEGIRFCSEYDSLCLDIRESDCTETYQHLAGKSYIPDEMGVPSWSTGLKDKKRREIYEADIVNLIPDGYVPFKAEVFFEDGSFLVRAGADRLYLGHYARARKNHTLVNCEVIGNIYENPELLGEKP